jgi:hypothetical protein
LLYLGFTSTLPLVSAKTPEFALTIRNKLLRKDVLHHTTHDKKKKQRPGHSIKIRIWGKGRERVFCQELQVKKSAKFPLK